MQGDCLNYIGTEGRVWINEEPNREALGRSIVSKLEIARIDASSSSFSYSVSFTDAGDDVPQWQIYGKGGRGVVFAISLDEISEGQKFYEEHGGEIIRPNLLIHNVIYDQGQIEEQVRTILDAAVRQRDAYQEEFVQGMNDPTDRAGGTAAHCIALLANQRIKASGYMHEHEWKAIPNVSGLEFVEFLKADGLVRPYIRMQFNPKAIKQVVIGSLLPFDQTRIAVELLFKKLGVKDVVIRQSNIQFV